jgi:hypothetical protein
MTILKKRFTALPCAVRSRSKRQNATTTILSSPIILYDYPQIAPESAGDLFDGTEIDEILTLRIMTLTEEEKREMRGTDSQAAVPRAVELIGSLVARILEEDKRQPALHQAIYQDQHNVAQGPINFSLSWPG